MSCKLEDLQAIINKLAEETDSEYGTPSKHKEDVGNTNDFSASHAFGVGALEEEDADVYEQDRLAEYDWEIGGCESDNNDDDEEDEEQAEIEAARLGRLSSTIKKKSNSNSTGRGKIIDGWTAPSQNRESHKVNKSSSSLDALPGFRCSSGKQDDIKIHQTQVSLPPGYIPVFNPRCILNANTKDNILLNEDKNPHIKHDAVSRARLLQEDSVYEKLDYIQQLRLKAAAAGLPVPPLGSNPSPVVGGQQSSQSENSSELTACNPPLPSSSSNPTAGLLKIFKNDSNKQARFEAYQVLIRRGFARRSYRCLILIE
ncbi:unnamed protein product [Trichobilharzia regenti]|nr:unnamed protein product [Trichobilharzia regenti]